MTEIRSKPLMSLNKPLLLVAYSSLFFFGITDNARGPAYPEILRQLDLTNTQGSFLFASSSFLSFVFSLSSHTWLKRMHLHLAIKVGLAQLVLSSLFMGLSAQFTSPVALILASILQGSGMGVCGVTMNLMVDKASPTSMRRRAFGGLHATYGIASLIAPLLYAQAVGFGLNWMHFFYFLAAIGPFFIFMPLGLKEKVYSKPNTKGPQTRLPKSLLLLLGLCVGMYVASEIVVSSRMVLYLEQGRSMSKDTASLYLSCFFLFLMSGRLVVGLVNFKLKGPTILYSSLILTLIFCAIGLTTHPFFLALTGLSMSVFFPSYMDWLAETFPDDFQKITSIVLSGIGLHLVAMHLGFGRIAGHLGVVKAMGLAPLLTFLSHFMLVFATQKVAHLEKPELPV
jgi:FHS family glucose/mannose:H+ symporter-like MFS transporter